METLTAKDITSIINAGFKANCQKIEYNGLIITYNTSPFGVVVPHTTPIETPSLANEHEALKAEAVAEAYKEDLMYSDPLKYEESLALEDNING